jgi:hypothetical protein
MKINQINLVGGLLLPLVFSLAAPAKSLDQTADSYQPSRQWVHVAKDQAEPDDHRLSAHPNDPVPAKPGPDDRRLASNRNEALAEQATQDGVLLAENRSSAIAEQATQDGVRLAMTELAKNFAQMRTV